MFETITQHYLETIRNNKAALIAFFNLMPKGGDIHHHYSGAVYAETYIDYVVEQNFWIHLQTLEIVENQPIDSFWVQFSELAQRGELAHYKLLLAHKWSIKNHYHTGVPNNQYFFNTFVHFDIAAQANFEKGLLELKNRAKLEHIYYLETIFLMPNYTIADMSALDGYPAILRELQSQKDISKTQETLSLIYNTILEPTHLQGFIKNYNSFIHTLHSQLELDDNTFIMRYQNYVLRNLDIIPFLLQCIAAFSSAQQSEWIVGVNIVGIEDEERALNDYWLHLQIFHFCAKLFPKVRYALHAGELTIGMTKPEELTWHIYEALQVAEAQRIGHGVSLPYETHCYDILALMRERKIPIEINLSSNEFILGIKDSEHPILMYHQAGVPIVICTDDAGILRINLAKEFVLLATRYPSINYLEIKQFVYNSIDFSFIPEPELKAGLRALLDKKFADFEQKNCWFISSLNGWVTNKCLRKN